MDAILHEARQLAQLNESGSPTDRAARFVAEYVPEMDYDIEYDGDETVVLTANHEGLYISIRWSIDHDHRGAYINPFGIGMIEYDGDPYWIIEDIEVVIDPFEHDAPDVQRIYREAQQERRDREQAYRRSVL